MLHTPQVLLWTRFVVDFIGFKVMDSQIHRISAVEHRPPSLSVSSAQGETERRRRSSTNASQNSGVNTFSPDRSDRRKPSSTATPFLYSSSGRKVSSSVSPRFEPIDTAASKHKQSEVLPTYRMAPQADRKFRPQVVKKIMDEAFEESLDGLNGYDSVKCRALTTQVFLNNDFSADGSAVPGNKGKLHERSKCCKFTSNLGERNFLINQEYAKPRELNIEIWTVFLPTISLKDPKRRHGKRNFLESFSGHKFP